MVQEENGGAGVYSADLRKNYLLQDPSWKHDIIPEIIGGHNVLDFIDPDIEARLEALDREEDALAAAAELEVSPCQSVNVLSSDQGRCLPAAWLATPEHLCSVNLHSKCKAWQSFHVP